MKALSEATIPALPAAGVSIPAYRRQEVTVGIAHFGVGGFHRAHQAVYIDELMAQGLAMDWGICGIGVLPGDAAMAEALRAQDHLYTLCVKHPDGRIEDRVIGSIVDFLHAPADEARILETLSAPATRIVSLTITEGGYEIDPGTREFAPSSEGARHDVAGLMPPRTAFGFIVEALRRRREAGTPPFTVLSCDNIRENGAVARTAILGFARLRDAELAAWIDAHVAFPNTMVDRITPVTAPTDVQALRERRDLEDRWPVVCEPFLQWVVEDRFTAGRPPLERVGVTMTDHVDPYELMKLRLLNGSHQVIGQLGRLAGIRFVHDVLADQVFVDLTRAYMEREAEPTLTPIPGVDFRDYERVLVERFSNPAVADTNERLVAYASDRTPPWNLPVATANLKGGGQTLVCALELAAWARAVCMPDDLGQPIRHTDNRIARMLEIAPLVRENPAAFLAEEDLLGGFVPNERFTAEFLDCWQLLDQYGARGAAERVLARLA